MYDVDSARYSVLFIGHMPSEEQCRALLERGIKVILLGAGPCSYHFESFTGAGLFFFYKYKGDIKLCIIDGELSDCRALFDRAVLESPTFNSEQYLIEHAPISEHIIVMAGAGTGKTHVMIDRMLFLFHMDPDIKLSEVCFVTFTNEATGNMSEKLIKGFNDRYGVIRDKGIREKYLKAIEELAQVNISTIHSFFKVLLAQVGTLMGYSKNISIRSFKEEKKDLIRDIIDEDYKKNGGSVRNYMVLSVNDMQKLALKFWETFDQKGLSDQEIQALDWGCAAKINSGKVQDILKNIFTEAGERHQENKRKYDAIDMQDITHELGTVVESEEIGDYINKKYKYIFCDEFQDSDDVQIQCMAAMTKLFRAKMFVVGDLKQSIYRFRGATDSAFEKLEKALNENYTEFSLKKNYRTAPDVLEKIQTIFNGWGNLLPDHIPLVPANPGPRKSSGEFEVIRLSGKNWYAKQKDREKKFIKKVRELEGKGNIEVLVRYNSQLDKVREWCERAQVVCYILERGTFYSSPAVLDMRRLLGSFLYPNVPMYQYEFLRSTYSESLLEPDILEPAEGVSDRLKLILDKAKPSWWHQSEKRFREEPLFTVLKDIVEGQHPAERYGCVRKSFYMTKEFKEKDANEQATVDMYQYDADLEKLMGILFQKFGQDKASLLDIYSYLEIMINTDKEEDRPLLQTGVSKGAVRGMTVHRAKGLQFENVIIPFMNYDYFNEDLDQIIFDEEMKQIGWCYHRSKEEIFNNDYYKKLVDEERKSISMDEARLLYVAMTRVVRGLYCYVEPGDNNENWASLLGRGVR